MTHTILILGPSWLGDAIMALPTLRELRRRFPDARLALLARAAVADLFRAVPEIDEVVLYRRPRGLSRMLPYRAVLRRLRALRPDVALILPRSFGAAWTAFRSGAARRIGYAASGRNFLLTDAVPREPRLLRTHRVHYYQHLLSALGGAPAPEAPSLAPPEDARATAARLLADGARRGPLVAVNPGATYGAAKQWSEERYAALCRRLRDEHAAAVFLVGGPGDRDTCDRIRHGAGHGVADLSGRTTVLELAALLERADLVVSNDTGAMHVAQAVGTPIVAIFGPTDPVTTAPYGDRHRLVREAVECAPCLQRTCPIDHRCMERIDVERVAAACREALGDRL